MTEEKIDDIRAEDAPSEEILEPPMGKGLPNYRPWDWIFGYGLAGVIAIIMFALADSTYNMG